MIQEVASKIHRLFGNLLCNELLNFLIDFSVSYILIKPVIVLSMLC